MSAPQLHPARMMIVAGKLSGSTYPPPAVIPPPVKPPPTNPPPVVINPPPVIVQPPASVSVGIGAVAPVVDADPPGCVYERSVRKLPGGGLQRVIVKICPDV